MNRQDGRYVFMGARRQARTALALRAAVGSLSPRLAVVLAAGAVPAEAVS
ncbi:MAG TPA: hypothetical protein VHT94_04965 [Streptosporangiaceae bacterium]|nr:hypothetical protein [Streptosporangiaceae bacterium]